MKPTKHLQLPVDVVLGLVATLRCSSRPSHWRLIYFKVICVCNCLCIKVIALTKQICFQSLFKDFKILRVYASWNTIKQSWCSIFKTCTVVPISLFILGSLSLWGPCKCLIETPDSVLNFSQRKQKRKHIFCMKTGDKE